MNYIRVFVYRPDFGDASNGGVTSNKDKMFFVKHPRGNFDEAYIEQLQSHGKAAVLEFVEPTSPLREPYFVEENTDQNNLPMFGGNFVFSNDSRFSQHYATHPVAVFDRFEN